MGARKKIEPIPKANILNTQAASLNHESYYRELTTRNRHFIPLETQSKLRNIKILIAGCGATGGACIEPLVRLGVENFILADNGEYELNNLNRQHATILNLGQNKAEFHQTQVLLINPHAKVQIHTEGLNEENLTKILSEADLVFDAVDVTNPDSMKIKLQLHVECKKLKKPVLTGLDLGFRQYGMGFDYRKKNVSVLGGFYSQAAKAHHPVKALFAFFPFKSIPNHCLGLVDDVLSPTPCSASQLGCASDLLSAIAVAAVVRFVAFDEVIKKWDFNLERIAVPVTKRIMAQIKAVPLRFKVLWKLRQPD